MGRVDVIRLTLHSALSTSGLTQRKVATAARLKPQYLSHLLAGTKRPGPKSIANLVHAFRAWPEIQEAILHAYLVETLKEISEFSDAAADTEGAIFRILQRKTAGEMVAPQLEELPPETPAGFVTALNQIIRESRRDPLLLGSVEQILRSAFSLRQNNQLPAVGGAPK